MPPDVPADESGHSRREFLGRTAYAAGLAGVTGLSADTILSEAAQATTRFSPLPKPRNVPIDHFVLLMMENRSFDHYFGWLRGYADASQKESYPNPEGELVSTRAASTLGSNGVRVQGLRPPRPGPRLELRPRPVHRRLPRAGQRQRRVRAQLLQPRRARLHPRGGPQLHALRPLLLLAARPHLAEPLLQVVGPVGRVQDEHDPARRQHLGDDLRPGARPRPDGQVLLLGPAVRRPLGPALFDLARADRAVLRRRRGRQAPEHRHRGPALQGRQRGGRALRRRAPARRRAPRPGLPGRRGERLRHLGQLPARRAVRHLRRVGRLLRPRAPRARAGRPREHRPERGLRPARASGCRPWPSRRTRATRAPPSAGASGAGGTTRATAWTTAATRTSRSSASSRYRFGLGFLNKRHKYANNIGHSFDFWGKPDFEPAELPDPPAIVTQPCALGGQDVEDSLETHQSDIDAPRADRGEAEGSRLRGHAGQDLHQAGHGEEGHRGRSLSALLI